MNRKVSSNQSPTGSTPVRDAHQPQQEGVWQQTKDLAAEAWLEFFKHSLIIVPLIALGWLMWLVEQSHVSVETQRLLDFGEFLITLIQLWKLVEHLVPASTFKGIKEFINRKAKSWKSNSNCSNAVGKVKLK
ncbi:hypothetical protein [Paraburkholderia fungorum]|uniref:hypothetical protein n=1 Tax=Paraburkholderia fungorum TaxID=134537 RepID=UPI001619E666|nr:hypothetical protein [Paraburkholderia fungorum]MBB5547723.1 hypothetical protein [Paraburkholderia fungorum]